MILVQPSHERSEMRPQPAREFVNVDGEQVRRLQKVIHLVRRTLNPTGFEESSRMSLAVLSPCLAQSGKSHRILLAIFKDLEVGLSSHREDHRAQLE